MQSRMCRKKVIPRPVIVKLQKCKDETLKALWAGGHITFKGAAAGLTADFSAVTMKARGSLPTRISKTSKKYLRRMKSRHFSDRS